MDNHLIPGSIMDHHVEALYPSGARQVWALNPTKFAWVLTLWALLTTGVWGASNADDSAVLSSPPTEMSHCDNQLDLLRVSRFPPIKPTKPQGPDTLFLIPAADALFLIPAVGHQEADPLAGLATRNQERSPSVVNARAARPSAGATEPVRASELQVLGPVRTMEDRLAMALHFAEEDLPPGEPTLPPPSEAAPTPPSAAAGEDTSSIDLSPSTTLGEAPPPPRNNLQFLRRQAVLLDPGEYQVDVGAVYTFSEYDLPLALVDGAGDVTGVIEGHFRQRLLYVPFEIRCGIAPRLQAFVNAPFGMSNAEFSFTDFDEQQTRWQVGDVSLGGSYLLCQSDDCSAEVDECSPDVIVTLAGTIPTSDNISPLQSLSPETSLGAGYWAFSADLLFIQTYDPLMIFYGLGYQHLFEDEFDGIAVQPGEQLSYRLGVGFAVNENVTLSTSFLGYYITDTYVQNVRVEGSTLEPARLRFSATIAKGHKIVEPFAEIGMTESAPAMRVGIVWTY